MKTLVGHLDVTCQVWAGAAITAAAGAGSGLGSSGTGAGEAQPGGVQTTWIFLSRLSAWWECAPDHSTMIRFVGPGPP
jgi:hypothetical protein